MRLCSLISSAIGKCGNLSGSLLAIFTIATIPFSAYSLPNTDKLQQASKESPLAAEPECDLVTSLTLAKSGQIPKAAECLLTLEASTRSQTSVSASTLFNAGLTLQKAGRPDAALSWYEMALKREPSHQNSLLNTGVLLVTKRRAHEALKVLTQITDSTDSCSSKASLYEGIARTMLARKNRGSFEDALRSYSSALECDTASQSLTTKGQITRSKLTKAQKGQLHFNMGITYDLIGELENAQEQYRLALQEYPAIVHSKELAGQFKAVPRKPKTEKNASTIDVS